MYPTVPSVGNVELAAAPRFLPHTQSTHKHQSPYTAVLCYQLKPLYAQLTKLNESLEGLTNGNMGAMQIPWSL